MSFKLFKGITRVVAGLLFAFACSTSGTQELFQCAKVIDGDTIRLSNGEKVRYIGINTPETHHPTLGLQPGGTDAYAINKKLVEGKQVRLEFDVEKRDRYGRLLAYVYLPEQGSAGKIFVNAWLVENGYAQVMTIPPNVKHQELFLKLQRKAREKNAGLWLNLTSALKPTPQSTGPNDVLPEIKMKTPFYQLCYRWTQKALMRIYKRVKRVKPVRKARD